MELKEIKEFEHVDEILQREVLIAGNGGRLNMPKRHRGKQVKVIVYNQKIKEEEIAI